MQVKIASFPTDSVLLPVLTTTPKWTRILSARRKPCNIWRDSNGISGPVGYRAMVVYEFCGETDRDRKTIAVLDIKRKMPGVWLRLLSCSWQHI
jgi:hypothetical protein